jgi:CRISPR-associated endoribonuclease Cas6
MPEQHYDDIMARIALVVTPLSHERVDPFLAVRAIQAFVYDTLAVGQPDLADQLHKTQGFKPFTVAFLLPTMHHRGHVKTVPPKPYAVIRLTALTQPVYHALVSGLLQRYHTSARLLLKPYEFEIHRIEFPDGGTATASSTTYAALYAQPPAHYIHMHFLTPTCFRAGRGSMPFPLPSSVYRGLWKKWQDFAPSSLRLSDTLMSVVEQYVFPAHYDLHTDIVRHRGAVPQRGCLGTCQFEALTGLSETELRSITALSHFAAYAGVGMKTTAGMGLTEVRCR